MLFRQLFSRYMYVKNDIRTKNSYVYVDEIDTNISAEISQHNFGFNYNYHTQKIFENYLCKSCFVLDSKMLVKSTHGRTYYRISHPATNFFFSLVVDKNFPLPSDVELCED